MSEDLQENFFSKPSEKEDGGSFENFVYKNRWRVVSFLFALILILTGVFIARRKDVSSTKIEVLENASETKSTDLVVVVEVAGAVKNSGVYELPKDSRVDDAINISGGLADDADFEWIKKTINKAAKLVDGQKLYIKSLGEQSGVASANNYIGDQSGSSTFGGGGGGFVNINSASQKTLEALWGIGPVTAQNIIEQRPYSNVEDLLKKGILKTNVYERNKDKLSVY